MLIRSWSDNLLINVHLFWRKSRFYCKLGSSICKWIDYIQNTVQRIGLQKVSLCSSNSFKHLSFQRRVRWGGGRGRAIILEHLSFQRHLLCVRWERGSERWRFRGKALILEPKKNITCAYLFLVLTFEFLASRQRRFIKHLLFLFNIFTQHVHLLHFPFFHVLLARSVP